MRSAVSAVIDRRPPTISLMWPGRHSDGLRQTVGGDPEFFEDFRQMLSGMDRLHVCHDGYR